MAEPPVTVALAIEHLLVVNYWFEHGCLSKREAAKAFGYTSAAGIFNRPDVKEACRQRVNSMMMRNALAEDDIIAEYRKIAFADGIGSLIEVDANGDGWVDLTGLTLEQRAAVSEFTTEVYNERGETDEDGHYQSREVKKTRIKFHDKKTALDSLARIMGMFKDKIEVVGAERLIAGIAAARQRLAFDVDEEGNVYNRTDHADPGATNGPARRRSGFRIDDGPSDDGRPDALAEDPDDAAPPQASVPPPRRRTQRAPD